jgi:hypothetical protein
MYWWRASRYDYEGRVSGFLYIEEFTRSSTAPIEVRRIVLARDE